MFVTISLIIGFFTVLYYFLTWNFDYWTKRGVPGPNPLPLLGTLPNTITMQRNVVYDINDIYQKYKGQTPFVGVFNSRRPQILVIDSEYVKDVLIRNFKNFHDSEFSDMFDKNTEPIFGRNPFLLKGDEWKEKRAEITPAFTISRIKALFPLMEDVCNRMTNFIKEEIPKKTSAGFDIKELSAQYTTDVVSSCIFAIDASSFTDKDAKIRAMGKRLFTPTFKLLAYLTVLSIAPFMKNIYSVRFLPDHVEKFFIGIMKDAIAYREKNKIVRADYLDYLLQLREKKNLSDLDMTAHTITFFTDGTETSSGAMAHVLYELARNKTVQDKLRQEIKDTIAQYGSINYENITEMPYLDQVIYETMRLHPPVVFITKLCTEDCKLKLRDGHEIDIEKGIVAIIPIYSIQRDPDHYVDAEKFIPERFDAENGGVKVFREKCVLLPFGDGPRICLGMRFALTQIKAGIVELIKNFEVMVNPKMKEPYVIDTTNFQYIPIGGIWLNFKTI